MKTISCFFVLCMMILTVESKAQSNMLENGFSLKFSFGFPPSQYGFDGDLPIPEELQLDNTFGLELGNQWYFYHGENFGLGLDVNWVDMVYGKAKTSDPVLGDVTRVTLEGSFLEFGPVGTFAINDIVALEGYYNLRPTYMGTYFYENSASFFDPDDYVVLRDFSFLHGLGLGVRVKFLFIGYEYTFGSLDGKIDADGEFEEAELYGEQKMGAGNSKLIIGFQF